MRHWIPDVTKRVAEHLANKSTDTLTSAIHRFRATKIYRDPSRDRVASEAPFPLLPSALLQDGTVYAEKVGSRGPSVLVTRNGGNVRAFRNACRHRGSPLLKNGRQTQGPALTCPYHAWMYDARTGALKGVPGERVGFPCLDKNQMSLAELPCFEQAGFVWVGGRPDLKDLYSLEQVDEEVSAVLPSHDESPRLIADKQWNVAANWQLVVETFLEAYHVSSLHRTTLATVAHSLMVTDVFDQHSYRMTVPLRHFDSDTILSDESRFFDQTTTTYFLFPCTAISLFKRFVLFVSVQPDGNANSAIRAWGIQRPEVEGDASKDFDNVIAGVEEDWCCAEAIFQNIDSESVFTYGKQEGGNVLFLENVEQAAERLRDDS